MEGHLYSLLELSASQLARDLIYSGALPKGLLFLALKHSF